MAGHLRAMAFDPLTKVMSEALAELRKRKAAHAERMECAGREIDED